MRVLILIDAWFPFTGGAQIQIRNLKKILEKSNKCKYFILHSPSSAIFIRLVWFIWVIPQAIFLHSKHKFDLIHAHAYWPGVPGKILSWILKIPIVFTVHGSNLLDLEVKSPRAFLEKIILTKVKYDQLISVSSSFLKHKNVNKNIAVIANGVDLQKFKIKNAKVKIKTQNLKILFVGRLEKVKGVEYLIKAFEKVSKKIKNIRLIIIGKGSKEKDLKKLADRLKVKNKILFKGYLSYDDLIEEYQTADLFVLPSLSEGQPLTLLEAWAAKLPVVVTDVGENPKMVENGINGCLVKPVDSLALSKAIVGVLKDKNRNLMGNRGYQQVLKKYTWQKCAQKTYEVYQKL